MIVFLLINEIYWSKGKTLTEAIAELKKQSGKKSFKNVGLFIYEAESVDTPLYVDEVGYVQRAKTTKKLYDALETISIS